MDPALKLAQLSRSYANHGRGCHGVLSVSVTPDGDGVLLQLHCPTCHDTYGETFTVDDALALRHSGISSEADFMRVLEQSDRRSVN